MRFKSIEVRPACRALLLVGFAYFAVSCALTGKQEAPPANPSVKNELNKIEIEIRAGAYKKAAARLTKLIAHSSQTSGADDAYIMLGQVYYQLADYTESYRAYLSVLNWQFASPREVEAEIGAARALYKLARYDEALNLTKKVVRKKDVSKTFLLETHYLQYNLQWQLGDHLDALRSLVFLAENTDDATLRERYRIRANDFAESALKEDEVKMVASDSSFGFVRGPALYRVGVLSFESRDYDRAEAAFREVVAILPNSDLSQNSRNYIQQIEARRRVEPFTIGAVLPLSSKDSTVAQSAQRTLRGLEMGLGLFDKVPSDFKLAVVDSEANPDVARRAVERLVVEDSAIALVGDLISRTAEPVAQKADELGVPIIGLSQKSHLTQLGDNVFRNALTSQALVTELVQTAMEKYGMKRFAVLYPNDGYGVEYANLFWDEVLTRGGQIVGAQVYSHDEKDFRAPIQRLLGTFYLEDRQDEYVARLKKWYDDQKVVTKRMVLPDDVLPPVTDFDAIFIPDGVKSLGQITSRLKANEADKIWLLGTNIWNTPSLISRGTYMTDKTLFVDAKNAVTLSPQRAAFYAQYKHLYGEDPTVFEIQAYDTGTILRQMIQKGARTRPALREALSGIRQFDGIVGDINVSGDREFSRPLAVLTVHDGKIEAASGP